MLYGSFSDDTTDNATLSSGLGGSNSSLPQYAMSNSASAKATVEAHDLASTLAPYPAAECQFLNLRQAVAADGCTFGLSVDDGTRRPGRRGRREAEGHSRIERERGGGRVGSKPREEGPNIQKARAREGQAGQCPREERRGEGGALRTEIEKENLEGLNGEGKNEVGATATATATTRGSIP